MVIIFADVMLQMLQLDAMQDNKMSHRQVSSFVVLDLVCVIVT